MSDIAICVENLSKRYRIGLKEERHDTLGGAVTGLFTQPMKNFRRLRSLARFSRNGNESDDIIWALKDVSFQVNQGEVVGIIGRNGAGKSTLLKILSRITEPTEGCVRLNGRVSSLLEVGTGFHPELTGRENVYLNGTILGMRRKEIDRKFEEIVDFSGVEKFIDTPVKRYSSGMKVRLAFAVAAHLEPEIFLVDEVLAVGDAEFQKKCLGKMGEVSKAGRTIIFVSHNMPAVSALCPRALLLESGQIAYSGKTDGTIAKYLNIRESANGRELSQSIRREGSGTMRFTECAVADDTFGPGGRVGSNHGCSFLLNYRARDPDINLRNVSMSIVILDQFDQRLLTCSTQFVGADFVSLSSTGTVMCHIDNLPLVPDIYRVHLWCSEGGETADLIEDAGSFEVVPDDVFGTGRFPAKKFGRVVIPHSWELK